MARNSFPVQVTLTALVMYLSWQQSSSRDIKQKKVLLKKFRKRRVTRARGSVFSGLHPNTKGSRFSFGS